MSSHGRLDRYTSFHVSPPSSVIRISAFDWATSASVAEAMNPRFSSRNRTSNAIAPISGSLPCFHVFPRSSDQMYAAGPPTRPTPTMRGRRSRLPALTNGTCTTSNAHSPTTGAPSMAVTGVQVAPPSSVR